MYGSLFRVGIPLRNAGLMALIFILSHSVYIQGREPCVEDFQRKEIPQQTLFRRLLRKPVTGYG